MARSPRKSSPERRREDFTSTAVKRSPLRRRKSTSVLEDPEEALNRHPRDPRVASERRGVQDLPVEERRDREEACESRKVPDERLGLDLLLQVRLDVRAQGLFPVRRGEDDRDRPEAQGALEVEVLGPSRSAPARWSTAK